jgi:hypothetical protein
VVDRGQRRAHQPGGEQRLQERRMVGSQPCHPVAASHPEPLQAIGQAPNPAGQLRVGERATVAHQRYPVAGGPGSTLNPRANPEACPSGRHRSHGQGYAQPARQRQEATPATLTVMVTLAVWVASDKPGDLVAAPLAPVESAGSIQESLPNP